MDEKHMDEKQESKEFLGNTYLLGDLEANNYDVLN